MRSTRRSSLFGRTGFDGKLSMKLLGTLLIQKKYASGGHRSFDQFVICPIT